MMEKHELQKSLENDVEELEKKLEKETKELARLKEAMKMVKGMPEQKEKHTRELKKEPEPKKERLSEEIYRILRTNYNWKAVVGLVVGWFIGWYFNH